MGLFFSTVWFPGQILSTARHVIPADEWSRMDMHSVSCSERRRTVCCSKRHRNSSFTFRISTVGVVSCYAKHGERCAPSWRSFLQRPYIQTSHPNLEHISRTEQSVLFLRSMCFLLSQVWLCMGAQIRETLRRKFAAESRKWGTEVLSLDRALYLKQMKSTAGWNIPESLFLDNKLVPKINPPASAQPPMYPLDKISHSVLNQQNNMIQWSARKLSLWRCLATGSSVDQLEYLSVSSVTSMKVGKRFSWFRKERRSGIYILNSLSLIWLQRYHDITELFQYPFNGRIKKGSPLQNESACVSSSSNMLEFCSELPPSCLKTIHISLSLQRISNYSKLQETFEIFWLVQQIKSLKTWTIVPKFVFFFFTVWSLHSWCNLKKQDLWINYLNYL